MLRIVSLTGLALLLCVQLFGQTGVIQGRVFDEINNESLPFVNVIIDGTSEGTTTDLDGNYRLDGLEPGLYSLRFSFVGYKEQAFFEIQVSNSRPAVVDVALVESTAELGEVVVRGTPFTKPEESPVSLRSIGVTEIRRNPGANRDISKVVQTLPGVTTTVGFRNDLLIRGGGPGENRFYLDDVEVPTINHFTTQGASGGPVGLINVDFLREVDFYSGAFPANRGNALSSVFNFKQKDGRTDRLGFTATVSATDAGVTLEGPVGETGNFLFSTRYSYLQFLFDALELPFLPTYLDFQGKLKFKLNPKNEIYILGLGAIDDFVLNLDANETEEQQFLLGYIPENSQWNYTAGLVFKHYLENGYWTFVASRNTLHNQAIKFEDNDQTKPLILDYESEESETKLRVENTYRWKGFKTNVGVVYEYAQYENSTFNRVPTLSGGLQTFNFQSELDFHKYGLFAQISKKLIRDRLTLSAGFRIDGNTFSDEMENPLEHFSPRFSASFDLSDQWSINFNTGIYYQLPPYTLLGYQADDIFVNRENGIRYIQNKHLTGGIEYRTSFDAQITVEAYYKVYNDYPFLIRDSVSLANVGADFGTVGSEEAFPISSGRTYGLEFLYQQKLFKGFYGIFSYTIGRTEFDDIDGNLVPSSWDSRHIVNISGGKRFGKNWEVGLNWRFQSALPITPFDVERSALIENWTVFNRGLKDYRQVNTLRNEASHTLDIRIDKKWFFKKWSFNLFLDIENLYNNTLPQEELTVIRDDAGNPVIDPNNPDSYLTKFLVDEQGTIIPSIGIVVTY